jgi:hypothetical protein
MATFSPVQGRAFIGVGESSEEPPSLFLSLRPDVSPPSVAPSTPLRGFVCLRAKLDGHAFHPSCDATGCQGTIPSVMDGSGSDERLVELWMAVLS